MSYDYIDVDYNIKRSGMLVVSLVVSLKNSVP